jgi:hypothetical protein
VWTRLRRDGTQSIDIEQAAQVSLETVFKEIRERRVEVLREKYGIDVGEV